MKRLLLAFALLVASSIALAAVNINTATKEQLDALPGIGPVKAQAIIDYRNANGPFRSPEDVMKVRGIKEGEFGKIRDQISVSGATSVPAQAQREPARTAAPATRPAPAAPSKTAAPSTPATAPASQPAAAPSMPAASTAATAATAPAAGAKPTREEQKAARAKAKEEKAAKAKEEKEAKAKDKADRAAKAKEEKAAKAEARKSNASAKAASDAPPATSAKARP